MNSQSGAFRRALLLAAIALTAVASGRVTLRAQDDEECLMCHGERDFVTERDGREVSLFVNADKFSGSVHAEIGCVSCHADADPEHSFSAQPLAPVDCSVCHPDETDQYNRSLHGQALADGTYLAPRCITCHGKHDILSPNNPKAKTYVRNIPNLCGSCHKEGTRVSQLQSVAGTGRKALEQYSQSIHGDGLFKRGLIVTAVCTSCHSSHLILPHNDPESTINRNNIAKTCMQCHAQIEEVHLRVIRGELWEKRPHEIPSCIECHQPHKVRRVFYEESYPDTMCMSCHGDRNLTKTVNGKTVSLFVDEQSIRHSVHATSTCIRCHTNISPSRRPVCKDSGPVDCSICHAEPVAEYTKSVHGKLRAQGVDDAPTCADCHQHHNEQSHENLDSPTFSKNIPDLCGKCHQEGGKAARRYTGTEHQIVQNYRMSIHGKGLLASGLLVTATCIDCHTTHGELPAADPASSVNPDHVAETCSHCHLGIYEQFKQSIHSKTVNNTSKQLPVCSDCHQSHTIERVDLSDFRQQIINQCGRCHEDVLATYFDTFHGKVSKLGAANTAKCYDCHGSHDILPPSDPRSRLSHENVVNTCKTCHPNSNRKFVGYLTHATHHDKDKYPYLYYTFWFMTSLLVGVFAFSGVHTALWLPRAIREKRLQAAAEVAALPHQGRYYQRFDAFTRVLHVMVIVSFLTLAVTGMTIKFADVPVFQFVSKMIGGPAVSGILHRIAAIVTFSYFFLHIGQLIRKKRRQKMSWRKMLTGENTMMFGVKDLREFAATMKWFMGLGPRPKFGRWTYWEKFDYFAVFWGVAIIGASGLLLWFSEFFTRLGVPGWLVNVATIIHSDEALLATGFIFTIHFFNTHFRPDKFPMDPVIFTGSVSLDELKYDRPREYSQVIHSREIGERIVAPPPRWLRIAARIFGFTALTIGLITVVLIIYAMLFAYK